MKEIAVDNTILSDVAKCQTWAVVRHKLGLDPESDASRAPLEAGKAVHLALAERFRGRSVKDAVATMLRAYRPWSEKWLEPDHRLWWEHVAGMATVHLKDLEVAEFPLVVDPEKHVEMVVSRPFGKVAGTNVLYVGRLDLLGKRRQRDVWWVVDHKTTSRLGDWWLWEQETTSQYTGYAWVVEPMVAEVEGQLGGVMVNGLTLPAVPKSDRKCPMHGVPYPECRYQHVEGQQVWLKKQPHKIAPWKVAVGELVERYLALPDDPTKSLLDGSFKRACSMCALKEWCHKLGRPKGMMDNWTERRWDPTAVEDAAA